MEYKDFLKNIRFEVENRVEPGTKVYIRRVTKNNRRMMDGMTILREGDNVSPSICLNSFYEKYENGVPLELIAEQILSAYHTNRRAGKIDMSFYLDFEQVREHLVCRIVHYEKNRSFLENVPHVRFLDLAVLYYCEIDHPVLGAASILVQKSHLKLWGADQRTIHSIAVSNTMRLSPHELVGIAELVGDMTGINLDETAIREIPMYVLTNKKKCFGAVNLYFGNVLDKVGKELRTDFYLLPSSIHECMVVPIVENTTISAHELQSMVREINDEFVAEEEILGYSVYRYYRSSRTLIIAAAGE